MQQITAPAWQILDVGSIWIKEFASALARIQPVDAWQPRMLATGLFQHWEASIELADPPLNIREFPLQRGYARHPLRWLKPYEGPLLCRLLANAEDATRSALICTTPYYAPVAERWPGPVGYYSTDLTSAYAGADAKRVIELETLMCSVAQRVYPNSKRIADHLIRNANCSPDKITIIPNATRSSNVAVSPSSEPGPLPQDIADLKRPIAGVLGDLSGNMDWELLAETVSMTPDFNWVFVGPAVRPIADSKQRKARQWVQQRARFVGAKAYRELQRYARALDVAVLPYRLKEPTYSGSSTRFYEHLAALRPMVATRGFAELLEKEPLLTLVDTPNELAETMFALRRQGFRDGLEVRRWKESREGTWDKRAQMMCRDMMHSSRSEDASLEPTYKGIYSNNR